MRVKGWENTQNSNSTYPKLSAQKSTPFKNPNSKPKPKPISPYILRRQFSQPTFTDRRRLAVQTTTIHHISCRGHYDSLWIIAAVKGADNSQLLHPLTLKHHHYNLPDNFNLFNLNFYNDDLASFLSTNFSFDKLVIPLRRSKIMSDNTMLVLYGGGKLIGRPFLIDEEKWTPWVTLSDDKFDDIVVVTKRKNRKTYALGREGKLFLIKNNITSRFLGLSRDVVFDPVDLGPGPVRWRKRLLFGERWMMWEGYVYMVVRIEEKLFRVYILFREGRSAHWSEVKTNFHREALFVSKDCCYFMRYVRKEYRNCIVFSEAGFPRYGDDGGWEYKCEDEIWAFRLTDGCYGKVGESDDFPEINWSPPSWVFDVESCSKSHSRSQSEGEADEDDEGVQSDSKDSNSKDEEEREGMESDSNSVDREQEERSDSDEQEERSDSDDDDQDDGNMQCDSDDEDMQSNADNEGDTSLQEDVPASLFASVSALEEEVTKSLLRMNGGYEATIEKESSRKNITMSAPRACTSSSTTKVNQSDTATTKFEGFDIRSDLVPILQKIWRKHGNIIERSTMRSGHIIARALESLATMVQILEDNPVQSISDCQADYLSTTLSDLKTMCFRVHWLGSFVEKVVKLHKSKSLVDSLNKLTDLSSQVKERRAILLDEVTKLTEEENKLKKEMAKVSKLIPLSGQVKLDEPLGSGLT
ncbi:hypothetical protein RND81_14G171900 [Saponaria officinalis]|uniref:DUF295 domain-containing protein n=1 Tax=Saponaria officinalis TaxID=3572 RepID=A0AAW1GNF2_SAPOF